MLYGTSLLWPNPSVSPNHHLSNNLLFLTYNLVKRYSQVSAWFPSALWRQPWPTKSQLLCLLSKYSPCFLSLSTASLTLYDTHLRDSDAYIHDSTMGTPYTEFCASRLLHSSLSPSSSAKTLHNTSVMVQITFKFFPNLQNQFIDSIF